MRLISQDGKIDIPYENNVIYIQAIYGYNKEKKCHDVTGYKIITPIGDDTWNLGEYSNEVKALCVMEMLHQQYMRHLATVLADKKAGTAYFKFPTDINKDEQLKGE